MRWFLCVQNSANTCQYHHVQRIFQMRHSANRLAIFSRFFEASINRLQRLVFGHFSFCHFSNECRAILNALYLLKFRYFVISHRNCEYLSNHYFITGFMDTAQGYSYTNGGHVHIHNRSTLSNGIPSRNQRMDHAN